MGTERRKIMLVDDNLTNLSAAKNMLMNIYEVYPLSSAAKLFKFLEKVTPDLILLDIEMPEMNGYETLKLLKADPKTAGIPVIFLTALGGDRGRQESGVVDYIEKPFEAAFLIEQISKHLPGGGKG